MNARLTAAFCALAFVFATFGSAQAEATKIRIAKETGLIYIPFMIMEHDKLIEKKAKEAGLGDVAAEWTVSSGGNVMNDALLSGSLDIALAGIPAFLVLWDKTRDNIGVKAISAYGSVPHMLLTRNPKVKSIKDFTDADKIAVPAVRASIQAIELEMAAAKAFGFENYARLDPFTISRSHPDGATALMSNAGEINSHFSISPFQQQELKAPGVHVVLTTRDVFGGPVSNGVAYSTQKFHDENPRLYGVFTAALQDAMQRILRDKRAAAQIYVEMTNGAYAVDDILKLMNEPGVEYTTTPRHAMTIARFMAKVGSIKNHPASWKELSFPQAHALPAT